MHWAKLIASLLLCQAAGIIGSFFTRSSVSTWYTTLAKPSFNPPSWLFAPVWTLLFLLMGVALYLLWTNEAPWQVMALFGLQLVLNILWSALFFGMRAPGAAFIEIIVLWLAILATAILAYKVSPTAAYLLIPYLVWVAFAAVLNGAIWRLNG